MKKLILAIKALILKAIDRMLCNELYMAFNGDNFYFILGDLDNYLRAKTKYGEESREADRAYGNVRDTLYDLMEQYGVDFDHVE